MLIRKAVEDDYEAVLRIMCQVQDMHVEWRPDIYKSNKELISREGYLAALNGYAFYVAEKEGKVVGVLGLQYRHIETQSHVTRDVIFIDSMAVDEQFRGIGIAHAFFDKVKEIARERQADAIELQVNARNKRAYEMYSKYGFTDKSITMELRGW